MADLDRNKPYAQIVNDEHGRHYLQGERYFTADGKEWLDASTAPAKPSKKSAPASQLDAQLQEQA